MVSVSEIRRAIDDAELQIRQANYCLEDIVEILVGKLRTSSRYCKYSYQHARNLAKLKKELRRFDAVRMQWKD